MARILVVGEFDSDNMGDVLIGASQKRALELFGHDPIIRPLEPNRKIESSLENGRAKSFGRALHQAAYSRSIFYRHALDARQLQQERTTYQTYVDDILANVELVLIGGGQLLSDDSLRMMSRIDQIVRTARNRSLPVAACATGASPPRSRAARRLFKEILTHANSLSAFRDTISQKLAAQYSDESSLETTVCPDAAIPLARQLSLGAHRKIKDVVGLAPISPVVRYSTENTINLLRVWWTHLAGELHRRGKEVEFFSTGTLADQHFCESLAHELQRDGIYVRIAPRPQDVTEFVELVSSYRSALTQRMHAAVVRFASGQTPLSLPWDLKLHSFFFERGFQDRLLTSEFLPVNDVVDKLSETIDCSSSAERTAEFVLATIGKIVSEGLKGRR